jgi:cobalt/nickel transport system permease protein
MHHSYIDRFAQQDSAVARLDARAKLLAVLAYSFVLISFGRYELAALTPMCVLPLAMLAMGQVPLWFAFRRVLMLCPFVLALALGGVLFDRAPREVTLGPWHFAAAGGWITAGNVAAKFAMGLLALTALVCTTQFSLLLEAMRKLAMPRLLVMELSFLYRYIFVLIDEAMRVRRARDFRGAARAGFGRRLAAAGSVVGAIFLRTLDRSQRIQVAMCARGYSGQPHSLSRLKFRAADAVFLLVVAAYLVICRGLTWAR